MTSQDHHSDTLDVEPPIAAPRPAHPFEGRINTVTTTDPWLWLAAGWKDLSRAPAYSITMGVIFAGAGLVVTAGLYYMGVPYLIWPMAAGFILIAPIFCTGFYGISRRLEQGEKPVWKDVFMTWRIHTGSVLSAGLALVFFMLIWVRLAALIYAINFPHSSLSVRDIAVETLFTTNGLVFLSVGVAIGGVLAVFAFLVSAVSLQAIVDGKATFVPAVILSILSVFRNFLPMLIWAAIIVLFTVAGFAFSYIGLAITLPLIGHASWHAYRAIIRNPEEAA